MQLPILVAIISVTGALLGTITGGVIVTYGNVYLAQRREQLEFRTACRLIATELQIAQHIVNLALDNHRWWRPDEELTTEAWKQYKHVLAPQLSYEAWSDVWLAVRGVNHANLLAAAPRPQGSTAEILLPETENALRLLLKGLETGRVALMPHLL
jgi:hypothetical protein